LHIKRLEIHGFKSFADRTSLELAPGITVAVGPNGCGKSNIADALRWVLGEQSVRLLRGVRMEDIIFNGAASRKPLGFAEVSVTMDHNDGRLGLDYREVTVSRRLYRDGTSEYLLNRRVCRLKEILDMFMDTGIGKEAYSFIGQGRIDEILHARPEERRLIFEEAAGVQKYKNRKREAERRLFETHENLLRVDDIIRELSAQLEPLQAQAASARRYLDLRDELKNTEVALFVHDAGNSRNRIRETESLCRKAADESLHRQADIAKRDAELTACQIALDEKQALLTKTQYETQHLSAEMEKARGMLVLTEEKLRSIQHLAASLSADISESNRQVAALETGDRQDQNEVAEVTESIIKLSAELVDLENSLRAMDNPPEAELVRLSQVELDNLLTEMRTLQSESERQRLGSEQVTAQMDRLRQEKEKKAEALSLIEGKRANLLAAQSSLRQEWELKLSRKSTSQRQAEELQAQKELLDRQIREGEKRLAATEGRLRLLQELESTHTGYTHGVKVILEAKKANDPVIRDVLGTVADFLQVPAPFVAAVEAALGPALLNLVTKDDTVAKGAIAWLKKVNGGRATFLPLNLLALQQSQRKAANLQHFDGYLGVASSLVDAPSPFKKVVEMLLSRVHIVRDLDTAVPVARALHFRERVATLDGELIQPGGAMTGGREKSRAGILSRRREIGELAQAQAKEGEQLHALTGEQTVLSGKLETELQLSKELDDQCFRYEQEIALEEREITLLCEHALALAASLASLEEEAVVLTEQVAVFSAAGQTALKSLEELAGREREVRVNLAHLQGKLAAREQERSDLRERHTECRFRLAASREKQEYFAAANERQAKVKHELSTAIRQKEDELGKCQVSSLELKHELSAAREEEAALEQALKQLISELSLRENSVRMLSSQLQTKRDGLRQSEKEFSALERRQHRLELEREKSEHELQAVLDRLRHSWQLSLEEAEMLSPALVDHSAALERAAGLKQELLSVGTVNLGAIDEHLRITERIDFLTAQRNDLSAAGNDLQKIIRDVDVLMAEKFAAAFDVLNENFGQVFRELFGGGKSLLKLTDPKNLLESGVEIIAQPPGKRLQHLSLLSGGEKALTAIALLFAFLRVKPAPFCVLDEIDTALDEANLTRFNSYLRRLSAETQFILITHRKNTMEQADMLYGVTMEEPGISKLISVRLGAPAYRETNAG